MVTTHAANNPVLTLSTFWKLNWKSWTPPRVKSFMWLACLDGCWGVWLARRGLQHPWVACCATSRWRTDCSFSRTIWHEVLSWIQSTSRLPVADDDFVDWWSIALHSTPARCTRAPRWWSCSRPGGSGSIATRPSLTTVGPPWPPCLTRSRMRHVHGKTRGLVTFLARFYQCMVRCSSFLWLVHKPPFLSIHRNTMLFMFSEKKLVFNCWSIMCKKSLGSRCL